MAMDRFVTVSPLGLTLVASAPFSTRNGPLALFQGEGSGMDGRQGCKALLEPRWHGVHDLLTRLLGRCTCEAGDAHVVELYRPVVATTHREAS